MDFTMFRWFMLSFAFLGAIIYAKKDSIKDRIVEYDTKNKEFSIVVIKDKDLDDATAKKYAIKRAAELTVKKGYRYFEIRSEEDILYMQGKKGWPSTYDVPQDLYEEEIIERGFNRERFIQKDEADSSPRPALRFKIECVREETRVSYDACDYTKCK